jgi:hypothetical protein
MSLKLPPSVAAYFDAANNGNAEGAALCFAENAVVRDEGRDMRGRAAIRAWRKKALRNTRPSPLRLRRANPAAS